MFFAFEGGGFLSSASGYSKGLSLLLLGQKTDDKPMRVAPWNQYQLVDQDTNSDLQLASGKNRLSRGCASFVCFTRASAGLDGQSPLKVGPTEPRDNLPRIPTIERVKELNTTIYNDNNDITARHVSLRSSMKRSSQNVPETISKNGEQEPQTEESTDPEGIKEKRKVQWTDACGKELTEIREFEMSERGESDDEFANGNRKTCSCSIM